MMIFVLIAATYTPYCIRPLAENGGRRLLVAVWGIAVLGMSFKLFFVWCPRWVSSVLYIAMGWSCVSCLPQMVAGLSSASFGWLLAGGIIYSAGGVLYALRLSAFNDRHPNFGSHEIFHLFVLAGSFCHFLSVWLMF